MQGIKYHSPKQHKKIAETRTVTGVTAILFSPNCQRWDYNTLFLLCQLFSLFFICSYFVLFFRFFFYRFLVVIPWLLFFGFYSLAFIPLLLFPYFILWLLFLIFWGSPRISAAYTARSALLRFRIIHAKRLHRYRLHHLRLKRSVGIICRRLCDRIYDVHTLRHLSERRISAV